MGIFLKPATHTVWAWLIVAYCAIIATYCGLQRFRTNSWGTMKLCIIHPLLDQPGSCDTIFGTKGPFQIVLASWFFFTFIFTTSYKSCMVSDLITPTVVEPPSTFRELFNSNFNISRTSEFSMESLHELEAHLKSLGISNLDRVTGFRENHHLHEVRFILARFK